MERFLQFLWLCVLLSIPSTLVMHVVWNNALIEAIDGLNKISFFQGYLISFIIIYFTTKEEKE